MKKLTLIAAAIAAVNAFAITATKEYVDNATNATLAASKSYTDQAVAGAVPGNYETVSNRAMNAVQTETDPVFSSYKGSSTFTNDVRGSARGVYAPLSMNGTETLDVSGNAEITARDGGTVFIRNGGTLQAKSGSTVTVENGATLSVQGSRSFGDYGLTDPANTYLAKSGGTMTGELIANDQITANGGFFCGGTSSFEDLVAVNGDAEFYNAVTMQEGSYLDINSEANFYSGTTLWVADPANVLKLAYANGAHWRSGFGNYETIDERIARLSPAPDFTTNNATLVSTATTVSEGVNATTRAIVATWENFLDGSNVVFSITNYISGTYNLDTAKLRIMEMTNGVYREVYNSRDEILLHIEDFKNTDFRVATNQVIQGVSAALADKADKAWGKYTSSGGEAPSNTVYMTAPNTVFAGGMEYERVAVGEGAVCILTTKGAPVYTQGDEGTFKFQDDGGTNYFGFAKTDSYVIGANASGISVQNHIVTINYDVTMSGVPCIWYKQAIESDVEWEQLNLPDGTPIAGASHVVSWEATPPAGRETCYINCPEAKGFFKATIEVPGSAKFMTNMPADFSGGILCTDGEHKVKINWNNGAPTLVPAN